MSSKKLSVIALVVITVIVSLPVQGQAAPAELLVNGSFETGDLTGWTAVSSPGFYSRESWVWNVSPAGPAIHWFSQPRVPSDGTYEAWNYFEGSGPGEMSLYQEVSIPAGWFAQFSFDYRVQYWLNPGVNIPRQLFFDVRSPSGAVLTSTEVFSTLEGWDGSNQKGDTGWRTFNADLSGFAGQTIRVQFREVIPQHFDGPAQVEIDNVSLLGSPETIVIVSKPWEPDDDRINRTPEDAGAPAAIYCVEWGIEVRIIDPATNKGIDPPAITVLNEQIAATGIPVGVHARLGEAGTLSLWRLTTGEFQFNATYTGSDKPYIVAWDQCMPTRFYHVDY